MEQELLVVVFILKLVKTTCHIFFPAATIKPNDQFKFNYVYKGSNQSRGKQLYYVYGIGFNSKDDRFRVCKQYKPKGRGYVWPSSFRKGNHFYYDLSFVTKGKEINN